ncbi:MAG: hypothetical protein ABIR06_07475 [Cyclobacteriaceae bacterium]
MPAEAQIFPIFSFSINGFNKDGHQDILAVGNLYSVQPDLGRYDAGHGLMLRGDNKGNFRAVSLKDSGFVVEGEGRDIKQVTTRKGKSIFLVSRNNDSLMVFSPSINSAGTP